MRIFSCQNGWRKLINGDTNFFFTMRSLIIFLILVHFQSFSQTRLDSLINDEINEYRLSKGLNEVILSEVLFNSATVQTDTMFFKGYMGHNNYGVYETLLDRYKFFGGKTKSYYIGEVCNLVYIVVKNDEDHIRKIAAKVVNSWKKSEKHNEILLNPEYDHIGSSSKIKVTPTGIKNYTHYGIITTSVFESKKMRFHK